MRARSGVRIICRFGPRWPDARRGARRLGSRDRPGGAARAGLGLAGRARSGDDPARRASRARGGALVEQRRHRQRRHHRGDRRAAADRAAADPSNRSSAPPRRCTTALPAARSSTRPAGRSASRPARRFAASRSPSRRAIAWTTAAEVLKRGSRRGDSSGLPVRPSSCRRSSAAGPQEQALLIVGVTTGSPADAAGVLVGDILLQFDGHAIQSAEDLLDLLVGDRVGRAVPRHCLRGGSPLEIALTVGARRDRRDESVQVVRRSDWGPAGRSPGRDMRVILVGPAEERRRLRARMPAAIDIVGEALEPGRRPHAAAGGRG